MAANQEWVWIDPAVVLAVHDEQLAEHGGAAGVRDAGLLDSALARPRNLAHYGAPDGSEHPPADDIRRPPPEGYESSGQATLTHELAAAYAFGLVKNHPFVDGNKRSAFVATELFLVLNGWRLTATDADCVLTMLALASSDIDEPRYADWLRSHTEPC